MIELPNKLCLCQGYPSPAVPQSPRVQTDVALPPLQKLAPSDSRVKERLFVVFKPLPLPMDVLEDVFWYERPLFSSIHCLLTLTTDKLLV